MTQGRSAQGAWQKHEILTHSRLLFFSRMQIQSKMEADDKGFEGEGMIDCCQSRNEKDVLVCV